MVEPKLHWGIRWQDGHWVSFPAGFVETSGNKQYLRLKATHNGLVNFLSKNKGSQNGSFTASQEYATLMQLRNDAAAGLNKQEKPKVSGDAVDAKLFAGDCLRQTSEDDTPQQSKKRKYAPTGDYTGNGNGGRWHNG